MLPESREVEDAHGNGEIGESSWTVLWMRPWGLANYCLDPTLVVLTSELRVVSSSSRKVKLLQRTVLEASDITWEARKNKRMCRG